MFSYLVKQYEGAELNFICDELKKVACAEGLNFAICDGVSGEYAVIRDKFSRLNEKKSVRKAKGVYYSPICRNLLFCLFVRLIINGT